MSCPLSLESGTADSVHSSASRATTSWEAATAMIPTRAPASCGCGWARRGGVLARGRYGLAPGRAERVALRVGPRNAARLRRRGATLQGREVDLDGRPRLIE